jgi:DNA replication protein DnaC
MKANTTYQQTRDRLHTFGLQAIAEQLAPALEHAERDKPGYTQFLHTSSALKFKPLQQRRLQGWLRFAKLPARKTLEQFDFTAQPGTQDTALARIRALPGA